MSKLKRINYRKLLFSKGYRKYRIALLVLLVLGIAFWKCLPFPLFEDPYSTIITSRSGKLLGAHIASDEQWRFPELDSLPPKYVQAVLQYEDKRFFRHPGIDVFALGRALINNVKHGEIVSGASTLTMQTIRLSRKNRPRTYLEKMIEMVLALRLEASLSKRDILKLYASHAPFGGNVVGLRAASWRYFARSPHHLSWGEAATLAVLPNSPGLIHPGRSRKALRLKRNKLLRTLLQQQVIDSLTYNLSREEPIPEKTRPFPQHAYHALMHYVKQHKGKSARALHKTTLNYSYQLQLNKILKQHSQRLQANGIYNMAALIMDTRTGEVLGYTGNTPTDNPHKRGYSVDIIRAGRSTGSILKPFLYAGMLTEGSLLPHSLVPDIPMNFGNFSPKNYNLGYEGALPANKALARSLNVPAAQMLYDYGVPKFYYLLEKSGMRTLHSPASHYGLSLVLGGCEGTLWDVCGMYASLGRILLQYPMRSSRYHPADIHPPRLEAPPHKTAPKLPEATEDGLYSAAAIWFTLQALQDVERPHSESNWQAFSSSKPLAWKTGTSFGFRDAWAIGLTPRFVVGVWAGNASGEGRAGLIGVKAAAPALFDIFDMLPHAQNWFPPPYDDMTQTPVCAQSGYLAAPHCPQPDTAWIPLSGMQAKACPFHKRIHLNKTGKYRVNSQCAAVSSMQHQSWFVLPPAQEWYYRKSHPQYRDLPPLHPDCRQKATNAGIQMMEIIYPFELSAIYIPVELSGKSGKVVFEAAHRYEQASVFWHIDGQFVAKTRENHQIAVKPAPGWHTLKLFDEVGNVLQRRFHIVD